MSTKPTLTDLVIEQNEIEVMLQESMGEITPEIEERMDALLVQGASKIEAASYTINKLEWLAGLAETESKRLHDRAKQFAAISDKIKERMTLAVDKAFNGKIRTAKFTIYTQKSRDVILADLTPGTTIEMLYEERPDLVRVKKELDRVKCVELYKDPETRKTLPETLWFEEKEGERGIRIR